jgi:hypothetical protein
VVGTLKIHSKIDIMTWGLIKSEIEVSWLRKGKRCV